jgi:hypothetical protein
MTEEAVFLWRVAKVLTLPQTAEVLGISQTALKSRCRRVGIERWPYRRLQMLYGLLNEPRLSREDRLFVHGVIVASETHRFDLTEEVEGRLERLAQGKYKRTHAAKKKRRSSCLPK